MKTIGLMVFACILCCSFFTKVHGQSSKLEGYHVGIVQPILSVNRGDAQYFYQNEIYTIGFPIGLTFKMGTSVKFDLEMVPFFKPNVDLQRPYEINLLFHPGLLFPLGSAWTFGTRLAFETAGSFGITALINKGFNMGGDRVFFVEMVFPGRWGPDKNAAYTQSLAFHFGIGF